MDELEGLKKRSTTPIKLKDKPGRGGVMIDLKATFKFSPARIIIQKVRGRNNEIVVSAVIERDPESESNKKE